MKHTNGPWRIEDGFGPVAILAEGNRRVADVFGEDAKANGRLIRAAPEMVTMLKNIYHGNSHLPFHLGHIKKLLHDITLEEQYAPTDATKVERRG